MSRPVVKVCQRWLQLGDWHDFGRVQDFLLHQFGVEASAVYYKLDDTTYDIHNGTDLHAALSFHSARGRTDPMELYPLPPSKESTLSASSAAPDQDTAGVFFGHSDCFSLVHAYELRQNCSTKSAARPPRPLRAASVPPPRDAREALQRIADGGATTPAASLFLLGCISKNTYGFSYVLDSMNLLRKGIFLGKVLPQLARFALDPPIQYSHLLEGHRSSSVRFSRKQVAAVIARSILGGKLTGIFAETNAVVEARSRANCVLNALTRIVLGGEDAEGSVIVQKAVLARERLVSDASLSVCTTGLRVPIVHQFGSIELSDEPAQVWFCSSNVTSKFIDLGFKTRAKRICLEPEILVLSELAEALKSDEVIIAQGLRRYHEYHALGYTEINDSMQDRRLFCVDIDDFAQRIEEECFDRFAMVRFLNKWLAAFTADSCPERVALPIIPGNRPDLCCLVIAIAASITGKNIHIYSQNQPLLREWSSLTADLNSIRVCDIWNVIKRLHPIDGPVLHQVRRQVLVRHN